MSEFADDGHEWAGQHGDINLITALPRATAPGLQVRVGDEWVDATPPDDAVIINTGIMLERLTNGIIPIGWHRVVADARLRGRALQRRAVLPSPAVDGPVTRAVVLYPGHPQRFSAITAEHALDEVLYEINLVEDARRVG
jgi:hypothetical protein